MEEKKEFEIIDRKKIKDMYETKRLLSIGASIMAIFGACSMFASAALLNTKDVSFYYGLPLEFMSTFLTIGCAIHAKKEINKVKILKKYNEKSENEDKVEIPSEEYKLLLKDN